MTDGSKTRREKLLKFAGVAVVGILALIGLYHLNHKVAVYFIIFWFTIPGLMVLDNWSTIKKWITGRREPDRPE